jgi:hypothetical protein
VDTGAQDRLARWFDALERRHMADLSFRELRRGLQALSTIYVHRRETLASGAALNGAGKRAAFALFYAPLHFAVIRHVVRELDAASPPPARIFDLGCGTGAGGAAWAMEAAGKPSLIGVDLHPWAVEETRWTWSRFRLKATVRRERVERLRISGQRPAVLIAFTINELQGAVREKLLEDLLDVGASGGRALVVEPIARRASPWWKGWASRFRDAGGRDDDWRFRADLPEGWRRLDHAAGLDHRELTARTLYLGPTS